MTEKLDEISLKGAVAAGALAAAAVTGGSTGGHPTYLNHDEHQAEVKRQTFKNFAKQLDARAKTLADVITDKYAIGSDLALKVAKLALKYEKPSFPKAEDILAVCGIESSFKPHAVSQLKKDPAVGLMQVRPAVWKLDTQKLKSSVEEQIKVGSEILHGYYVKLKSKDAALQAYNVGLTNYMKKKGLNPRYVPKFDKDREMYEGVSNEDTRKVLLAVQQMFTNAFDDFETELEHTGGDHAAYKLKITAPFGELWFEISDMSSHVHSKGLRPADAPAFQRIVFGRRNGVGSSSDETYNFKTEADVLKFVKDAYNKHISVKAMSKAKIVWQGGVKPFDWGQYFLP